MRAHLIFSSIKASQDELATDEKKKKKRFKCTSLRDNSLPSTETEPGTIPMAGVLPIIYANFSFEIMAFDHNPTGHKLCGEQKKTCPEDLIIFFGGLAQRRPKGKARKKREIMHSSANQRKFAETKIKSVRLQRGWRQ